MKKFLGSKKKVITESSTVDKSVQCDNTDPYLHYLIFEKLPKYAKPSDGNFNTYLQILENTMDSFNIEEKDKVRFLWICIQGEALEKLKQSKFSINENTTWNQSVTILGQIFDSAQLTGNIQTLRQAKQQPGQDFHYFTKIVQQLVNNIFLQQQGYTDTQRELETIRYAIRGAREELKEKLKGIKYNSIEDLIAKAEHLEANLAVKGQ